MLTKTQEHILKFLFETKEEKHTIRGISKKLKKSSKVCASFTEEM